MRWSWSSLMSTAGSTGMMGLLGSGIVVDRQHGPVGPIVTAGDRDAAQRTPIPVDVRRDWDAIRHPNGDLLAIILRSLGGVQHGPQRGIVDAVQLAAHGAG